jgi:hypothetical protein
MRLSRKVLSLAVLVGGLYALQPTTAQAAGNGKFHALAVSARQAQQGFSPDLGFGSIPLPLNPAAVRAFDRNLATAARFTRHTGRVLYPLTPALRHFSQTGQASNALLARIQNREAFSLELARERALGILPIPPGQLRFLNAFDPGEGPQNNTYGGIQFTPPDGTPFAPVSNLNLFTYLPTFRASQGLP